MGFSETLVPKYAQEVYNRKTQEDFNHSETHIH